MTGGGVRQGEGSGEEGWQLSAIVHPLARSPARLDGVDDRLLRLQGLHLHQLGGRILHQCRRALQVGQEAKSPRGDDDGRRGGSRGRRGLRQAAAALLLGSGGGGSGGCGLREEQRERGLRCGPQGVLGLHVCAGGRVGRGRRRQAGGGDAARPWALVQAVMDRTLSLIVSPSGLGEPFTAACRLPRLGCHPRRGPRGLL